MNHKIGMPQLRFLGFDNVWKEVVLNDVAEFRKGKGISKSDIIEDGNLECIRYGELYTTYNELIVNVVSKTNLPLKGLELSVFNDVIIPASGETQLDIATASCVLKSGVALSGDLNIIRSSLNGIFLSFYLNSKKKLEIAKLAQGSSVVHLYSNQLKSLKLNVPTIPEQQKIASFLSAVDEKIQQLSRKKELLQQYKKGLMQQLFSGKLRFKDENGNDYADWKWVGGNELFDNISDKKHNSDLPILAITQDHGAIPRELINYQMTVTDASVASYKVVQRGDFIISLRTFQGGIEFSEYHGICSPAYNILRPSSEEVDKTFYKLYLKTSYYIRQLQKNLEGIRDGKMISYKYFSEIKLPFPSQPEQQKIAAFLSNIDTKIESTNQQITQTQSFKKGLLQQMFV
jgi:type I restriction enzyme S subunit